MLLRRFSPNARLAIVFWAVSLIIAAAILIIANVCAEAAPLAAQPLIWKSRLLMTWAGLTFAIAIILMVFALIIIRAGHRPRGGI